MSCPSWSSAHRISTEKVMFSGGGRALLLAWKIVLGGTNVVTNTIASTCSDMVENTDTEEKNSCVSSKHPVCNKLENFAQHNCDSKIVPNGDQNSVCSSSSESRDTTSCAISHNTSYIHNSIELDPKPLEFIPREVVSEKSDAANSLKNPQWLLSENSDVNCEYMFLASTSLGEKQKKKYKPWKKQVPSVNPETRFMCLTAGVLCYSNSCQSSAHRQHFIGAGCSDGIVR